mgnify:CR=1 FL=1
MGITNYGSRNYCIIDDRRSRIQDNMSMCLKHKREATRTVKDGIEYRCIVSKAELEKNIDGSLTIKKLIMK